MKKKRKWACWLWEVVQTKTIPAHAGWPAGCPPSPPPRLPLTPHSTFTTRPHFVTGSVTHTHTRHDVGEKSWGNTPGCIPAYTCTTFTPSISWPITEKISPHMAAFAAVVFISFKINDLFGAVDHFPVGLFQSNYGSSVRVFSEKFNLISLASGLMCNGLFTHDGSTAQPWSQLGRKKAVAYNHRSMSESDLCPWHII